MKKEKKISVTLGGLRETTTFTSAPVQLRKPTNGGPQANVTGYAGRWNAAALGASPALETSRAVLLSIGTEVALGSNMGTPEEAKAERSGETADPNPIGRFIEYRVFLEIIGKPLEKVNALIIREELNKTHGPLSADAPTRGAKYVRVHLVGPDKIGNGNRLLELTEVCGYQVKVFEPREILRRRAMYLQNNVHTFN